MKSIVQSEPGSGERCPLCNIVLYHVPGRFDPASGICHGCIRIKFGPPTMYHPELLKLLDADH